MPTASVRGVNINYDVLGEGGPWVLLIQGGRQDMELFRPLAEHFVAAGYRVILHDRRNTGGSAIALSGAGAEEELIADDAYFLCQQLNALPVIACGGAGGSRHCILLALRHPGSVRSLLLWWPSGGRPSAEQLAERYYGQLITAAESGGMAAVIEMPYYAERCQRVPANRDRLQQMDVGEFVATMHGWRQFFLAGADHPVIGVEAATLGTIQLPTCIVPGHDLIHPRHIGEALAEILPNAELHYLDAPERPESEPARSQAPARPPTSPGRDLPGLRLASPLAWNAVLVWPEALDQVIDSNRSSPGENQDLEQRARLAAAQLMRSNSFDLELAEDARTDLHAVPPRRILGCPSSRGGVQGGDQRSNAWRTRFTHHASSAEARARVGSSVARHRPAILKPICAREPMHARSSAVGSSARSASAS